METEYPTLGPTHCQILRSIPTVSDSDFRSRGRESSSAPPTLRSQNRIKIAGIEVMQKLRGAHSEDRIESVNRRPPASAGYPVVRTRSWSAFLMLQRRRLRYGCKTYCEKVYKRRLAHQHAQTIPERTERVNGKQTVGLPPVLTRSRPWSRFNFCSLIARPFYLLSFLAFMIAIGLPSGSCRAATTHSRPEHGGLTSTILV
jgi:hypothetical protein